MSGFGASVKSIDLKKALAKGGLMEQRVTTMVTLAAREDTKPYVPYDQGPLRDSAETESKPEEGLLIYGNANVPYARAQYYGYPNKRWPGTVGHWFEPSRAANLSKWIAIADKEAKDIAGA